MSNRLQILDNVLGGSLYVNRRFLDRFSWRKERKNFKGERNEKCFE
jgi:hypothetical protein